MYILYFLPKFNLVRVDITIQFIVGFIVEFIVDIIYCRNFLP